MQTMNNPFLINGYDGPEHFCGREKEMASLQSAIENGRNVTLIAPRRYGKTGLIRNFFYERKDCTCIYLDLFPIQNLTSFTNHLASAVVGALESRLERMGSVLRHFFKGCRPTLESRPDGGFLFSLNVVNETAANSLEETFRYLGSKKQRIVIALDEFQQVACFPEGNVEALLRSYIQTTPDIRFIFAGSRQHIMNEMFLSSTRPFYHSTQIMTLTPIEEEEYYSFANRFFQSRSLSISRESFQYLHKRFDGVTWYVQAVLNRLWERGVTIKTTQQIDEVVDDIVREHEYIYADLLNSQNPTSARLLLAVGKEGIVKEPTSSDFMAKYQLKAPSSVTSAMKNLFQTDLLYRDSRGIYVYDYLFGIWLSRQGI